MTVTDAVQQLSVALDVPHWNEIRDDIRSQVTSREWFHDYVPAIDGSGLIVQVLGQDEKEEKQEQRKEKKEVSL